MIYGSWFISKHIAQAPSHSRLYYFWALPQDFYFFLIDFLRSKKATR